MGSLEASKSFSSSEDMGVAANDNSSEVESGAGTNRNGLYLVKEAPKNAESPEGREGSEAAVEDKEAKEGPIEYAPDFEAILHSADTRFDKLKAGLGKRLSGIMERIGAFGKKAMSAMEKAFYKVVDASAKISEQFNELSGRMYLATMEKARQIVEDMLEDAAEERRKLAEQLKKAKEKLRERLKACADQRLQNKENAAYRAEVGRWADLEKARAKLNEKIKAHNANLRPGVPRVELEGAMPAPEAPTPAPPSAEKAPQVESSANNAPARASRTEAAPAPAEAVAAPAAETVASDIVEPVVVAEQAAQKAEGRFKGQDPMKLVDQWAKDAKEGRPLEDTVRTEAPKKFESRFKGAPEDLVNQWAEDMKAGRTLEDAVRPPQPEAPAVAAEASVPVPEAPTASNVVEGNFPWNESAPAAESDQETKAA